MFDRTVHHVYEGTVEVHYYYHADQTQVAALDRIEQKIDQLREQITGEEKDMSVRLDALSAAVQRNTDAEASAVTLLQSLADEVRAIEPTQQAIDQMADQISAQADSMAASIVANTPAAPQTAPQTTAPGSTTMGGGTTAPPPSTPDQGTPPPPPDQTTPSGGDVSGAGGSTGSTAGGDNTPPA